MNDEELSALIDHYGAQEQEGLAERNLFKYGTQNGDKAAKGYKMAERLGELPPVTEESYAAMERRYMQAVGVDHFGSPMVRRMLADERLARLVADSPEEWERASLWEKTMDAISSGLFRRDEAGGTAKLTREKETPDAGSLLVGDDADAAALAALDMDFEKIAQKAMKASPGSLLSGAYGGLQEHARQVEEERIYGAAEIAEARLQQGLLTSPDLSAIADAETLGEAVSEVLSNPMAAIMYPGLQSLSSTWVEGAAGAGLAMLNPMLGAMALGSGSYQQEYANTFLSTLEEEGVDMTDYDSIMKAYNDPGIRHRAEQRALGRAITVASFDTLGGIAAGFTMKPVSKAMALRRAKPSMLATATTNAVDDIAANAGVTAGGGKAVLQNMKNLSKRARDFLGAMQSNDFVTNAAAGIGENFAWQTIVGGALGAAGEAAGSLAIGDEVNLGDVILEAFAEGFTAPIDVITMRSEVIRQATVDRAAVMNAHDVATAVQATAELQDQSVLNARDVNAFANQIQQKVEGTKFGEVSFAAKDVQGFAQDLVRTSPTIAAQWQEAAATGGDIVIPFGELFRIRAENPQAFQALSENLRTGSEGMSLKEAVDFERNSAPGLQALVEQLANTSVQSAEREVRDGLATHKALQPLREQMLAAGISQGEVDTTLALESAILENIASMSGMSVEEWIAANPVAVQRINSRGNGFNQDGFNQPTESEKRRGNFDPNKRVISLFEKADESTFIHEMAHYWFDAMVRHAIATNAILPEVRVKDADGNTVPQPNREGRRLNKLLEDFFTWADAPGMKEGGLPEALKRWQEGGIEAQRAVQEKFAEGFEAYMLNGEAPTESLKGVFKQFVSWLKRVYRNVVGMNVDLSPEVKSLYDRLFVSEQAVADAQARMGDIGVFDDLIKAGISEEEFRAFVDMRDAARADSEARLVGAQKRDALLARSRQVREQRGLQKEYEAMVQEEKDAVFSLDQFRALHSLMGEGVKGQDGTVYRFKLSKESVESLSAKDKEWIERRGMIWSKRSSKNAQQVGIDYLSKLFGFDSPADMVAAMREAYTTNVDALAEESAAQKFLAQYGEAPTAEGMGRLAAVATQEAASLDVLATEAAALRRALGNRREFKEAVVAFAKAAIARKRLGIETLTASGRPVKRGLNSSGYRAAAERAGRKSFQAFTKGDTQTAAEAKQAQLIQMALAKEIDAALLRVSQFKKRVNNALKSKTIQGEYMVQVHKLANAMGFKRAKPYAQEQVSIDSFVTDHPELMGAYQALPETLFTNGVFVPRPVSEMTVEEFDAVSNLMDSLVSSGRGEMKNRQMQAAGNAAEILDKAKESIEANAKAVGRKAFEDDGGYRTGQEQGRTIRGFFLKHMSFTRFIQMLDGNKQGFLTRTIVWGANACGDRESTLQKKYGEMLNNAIKPLYNNLNKDVVEYKGKRYTKQQVAAVLLNAGNAGNRDRLLNNGLADEDIVALARSLSTDEILAIQKVWDVFEDVRKLAAEKERRVNGYEPEWAVPEPFEVISKDGQRIRLEGGYCPIKYDPNASTEAAFQQEQKSLEDERAAGYMAAQTSRTYTKARNAKVNPNLKIRLDLKGVFDGLNEVIHDVSWAEYVADFNRLWRGVTIGKGDDAVVHEGLGDLVFKYFGREGTAVGREWIKAIALNGQSISDPTSVFAYKLRHGISVAGLGFNLVSALVQTTGLIAASSRLGAGGVLSGLHEFASQPRDNIAGVNARSEFMRNRTNTRNREIFEVQNQLTGTPSKMADFERMAYAMMMKVQSIVDYATWNAAFKKGVEDGLSEVDAVKYADQEVINTQGSGMIKDRSQVENMNGWGQLWLSFYSFMGTAYNLGAMTLLGEADRTKKIAQLSTLFFVMPMIEAIMRDSLKIDGDDDEDEEKTMSDWVRFAVGNSVGFTLGTMVYTREIAGAVQNLIEGKPIWGWRGPSGARLISDLSGFVQQLSQGEIDEGLARATLNLAGSAMGVPSAQLWRMWTGIDAYFIEDKTDNPLVLGVGYSGDR